MKLVMVILFIFLVSITVRSRELTIAEKVMVSRMAKAKSVQTWMVDHIEAEHLNFEDFISFQVYKKSCLPMERKFKKIEEADESYSDQSKSLLVPYGLCQEGALGLSRLFIDQNNKEELIL